MAEHVKYYADLILPLPLPEPYTYSVPKDLESEISPGTRVMVPLGKRKTYQAIVYRLHKEQPLKYETKPIISVIDPKPAVLPVHFKFWKWMAEYYMCTMGEVYKAATSAIGKPGEKPTAGTAKFISLHEKITSQDLCSILEKLEKAPKQRELVKTYLQRIEDCNPSQKWPLIPKKDILAKTKASVQTIKALQGKKIIVEKQEIPLNLNEEQTGEPVKKLTSFQYNAIKEIDKQFEARNVVLLHGVTSSGKTEIYIHLIKHFIKEGKQVLYLLPEIALTAQIIKRLKNVFGGKVGVYHSRLSNRERKEIWNNVLNPNGQLCRIILGARSSLFLPFENLGLIIVDEEHETTYKQFNPAPRYHARDAAIMLANLQDCKALLGTATPSVESYFNARSGKYGLVNMEKRYGNMLLPEIKLADTRRAGKKKQMKSHFTPTLFEAINHTLKKKEQVILFQNRRGFAPFLECEDCGWIPQCGKCDVSLTYHRQFHSLICHYCGKYTALPEICPACKSSSIKTCGFGTEKIEDDIKIFFPGARVERMDLDSTRKKNSFENIINKFEAGSIDILVGTQMVSKGLDFEKVNLVGILNADNMLHFPDFRACERCFQLIYQVGGRAGRKNKRGNVIIQTGNPDHPVFRHIIENRFNDFFVRQLNERKEFKYPPYYRLIKITLKHKNLDILEDAAVDLAGSLQKIFGRRVLGPDFPLIPRIQNLHIKNILLKIEREQNLSRAKSLTKKEFGKLLSSPRYRSVQIVPDVDPY